MTSVFMAIPWPPKTTPNGERRPTTPLRRLTVSRGSISPDDSDSIEPDLRDLNTSLQVLTDIFPDIQPEVFREMLSTFSEQSRVQVVTETLLKNDAKWVRGRYRMPQEQQEHKEVAHRYKFKAQSLRKDTRGDPLATEEKFRAASYKNAVKEAFYQEFKGLSHSTIKAVLAEYNYSYSQARPTLLALVSKSWRFSITSFLTRRKPPSAENHPLVIWKPADPKTGSPAKPFLTKTKSPELDQELYDALIVPALAKQRADQLRNDWDLAQEINEAEAVEAGEMYDCECCFTPSTLEQMSACDKDGHYICFRCIRHSISAALYDQGWARNINTDRCTLRCVAPVTGGIEDCAGCIPRLFLKRALLEESDGEDQWRRLQERFDSEALMKSQLPLIQCPFCAYAEVDELQHCNNYPEFRINNRPIAAISALSALQFLYVQFIRIILRFVVLGTFLFLTLNYLLPRPLPIFKPFNDSVSRIARKRRGLKFTCLSPRCSRSSCINCHAEWHDIHICHESSKTQLRLTLERAMADAVKRTCPQCNLSFVKSEGCNKLTCVCGYNMCYVCRADIGKESYKHFCQHFRDRPGEPCRECDKCDLYRVEDEEAVVKRAKERAEREWWDRQGQEVGDTGNDHANKLTANHFQVQIDEPTFWERRRWEGWLDTLLDGVIA